MLTLSADEALERLPNRLATAIYTLRCRLKRQGIPLMRQFTVSTEGENRLGLREICQRYVDDQWVADHMTDEQAAESLLDQFKQAVFAELDLLEVQAVRN